MRAGWLLRWSVGAVVLLGGLGAAWAALDDFTRRPDSQLAGRILEHVDTRQQVVALTFDDGPAEPWTPRLLELLERHGAHATFFMLGTQVQRHPELVRQARHAGHQVGNHGSTHQPLVFRSLGFIRDEIDNTETLLRRAGVTGEIPFRAPQGRKLWFLPLLLEERGLLHVTQDVSLEAAPDGSAGPASMAAAVVGQVRPGSIVRLPDGLAAGEETLAATELVLQALERQGYRFLTVVELVHAAAEERRTRAHPRLTCPLPAEPARPVAALPPLEIPVPPGRSSW